MNGLDFNVGPAESDKGNFMIWDSIEARLSGASRDFDAIMASYESNDFLSLSSAIETALALRLQSCDDEISSLYAKRNAISRIFAAAIRRREATNTVLSAWFKLTELFYNDPNQLAQHFILLSNFAKLHQQNQAVVSEINRTRVRLIDELHRMSEFSADLLKWFDEQK